MLLSLCMIVKNEQDNLPRCLDSVKDIVDEMIIVDTGSSDSTVDIAKQYGAKVYFFPWNDNFSDARNYSLQHAAGDWILIMDADDELEKSHQQAVLDLVKRNEADAYFFQTVCYLGDTAGVDALNNLNIRLIKNKMGYFFSNPIHEQIYSNIKEINPSAKILNEPIKVYHYGYLDQKIKEHDKRNRNIRILQKELEQYPGYPFTLFNLGNEYFALGNYPKAIEFYEKCYAKFDIAQGYSSKLILKLVNCYMYSGRNDDALKLIEEGLNYYPDFTDLEYLRGMAYNSLDMPTLAIKHFAKCIEIGEAPIHLNMIPGTGNYRAYLMLGEVYYKLEDYEAAVENYLKAIQSNNKITIAFIKAIKALCKQTVSTKVLIEKIEAMHQYNIESFNFLVSEVLIEEKFYDLAIDYLEKEENTSGASDDITYKKALCKLFLKKYSNVSKLMDMVKSNDEYAVKATCAKALCKILENKFPSAGKLLTDRKLNQKDPVLKVYNTFYTLMKTGELTVLSEDENESAVYTVIIFDLLKVLLIVHEFEAFEKALNLLNSVTDKTVLLQLAKLYYAESCYDLACKEFMRSIKIFDVMDAEGAAMLHKLKLKGY